MVPVETIERMEVTECMVDIGRRKETESTAMMDARIIVVIIMVLTTTNSEMETVIEMSLTEADMAVANGEAVDGSGEC